MKHHPTATANAAAVTAMVAFVVCAAFFLVAPEFTMGVARTWFHGIDLSQLGRPEVTLGSLIWGLITIGAYAWGFGYVFAVAYNKFMK